MKIFAPIFLQLFSCLFFSPLTHPILSYPSPMLEVAEKCMDKGDSEKVGGNAWQKWRPKKAVAANPGIRPGHLTGIITRPPAFGHHRKSEGPVL